MLHIYIYDISRLRVNKQRKYYIAYRIDLFLSRFVEIRFVRIEKKFEKLIQ